MSMMGVSGGFMVKIVLMEASDPYSSCSYYLDCLIQSRRDLKGNHVMARSPETFRRL